jgi:hypothetical protein
MVADSFGNRNFMQPMGRLSMHSKCLDFFSFNLGGRGWEDFFHFSFVLSMFSRFPMCSPRVFQISLCLNHIGFAQSPPLLTDIGGTKGGSTPSFHRIFYFGGASTLSTFD